MSKQEEVLKDLTPLEHACVQAAQFGHSLVSALAYADGMDELEQMRLTASSSYEHQTIAIMEQALEATLPSASYEA